MSEMDNWRDERDQISRSDWNPAGMLDDDDDDDDDDVVGVWHEERDDLNNDQWDPADILDEPGRDSGVMDNWRDERDQI